MLFSTKMAPRYSESMIFRGSRGPKNEHNGSQNGFQRQPGSKSVLEGSWAPFGHDLGLHFGVENDLGARLKTTVETKAI